MARNAFTSAIYTYVGTYANLGTYTWVLGTHLFLTSRERSSSLRGSRPKRSIVLAPPPSFTTSGYELIAWLIRLIVNRYRSKYNSDGPKDFPCSLLTYVPPM
ncbi:hypothetical protein GGR54DRAFT_594833 [Hypoxylon sp. NC1633]|nr:hypothetical protein GGR54DRAFT_594833 [Hypoxylon sp. NC1633]